VVDHIHSESEHFEVPGMPDRIELTKTQISGILKPHSSSMFEVARVIEVGGGHFHSRWSLPLHEW
ncbi:unnamed protein product, partial [Ilex paraguariensis]